MRARSLLIMTLGFTILGCTRKAEAPPAEAKAADTSGPSVEIRTENDTMKVSGSDVDVKVQTDK